MGITARPRADGTLAYRAEVRLQGVQPHCQTFDSQREAEKFEASVLAAAHLAKSASAAKRLGEPSKIGGRRNYERAKWTDVLSHFMESPQCSPRGRDALRPAITRVENVAVGEMDEDWGWNYVKKTRAKRTKTGAPYAYSTIGAELTYMGLAARWWAKKNGVRDAELNISMACLPSGSDVKRDRRLEDGERELILAKIRARKKDAAHWECYFVLALETGARLQELAFAQWSELARADQLWKIPAEHTKKRKARRVPLSKKAREAIATLRLLSKPGEARIFHSMGATNAISKQFATMVASAGIKNLRFHDLRHEAISLMCIEKKKAPIKAIMDIVGHETYEAFSRYSHLRDDELIGLLD